MGYQDPFKHVMFTPVSAFIFVLFIFVSLIFVHVETNIVLDSTIYYLCELSQVNKCIQDSLFLSVKGEKSSNSQCL